MRALKLVLDAARYPRLHAWFPAMRHDEIFLNDARRTADFMKTLKTRTDLERTRIVWRGDRIEWLLARGFHEWFFGEIKAGRASWPE